MTEEEIMDTLGERITAIETVSQFTRDDMKVVKDDLRTINEKLDTLVRDKIVRDVHISYAKRAAAWVALAMTGAVNLVIELGRKFIL